MRRKGIGCIVAAVALSIAPLTACSSGSSDSATTTLSYFSWSQEKKMKPFIDAFEAENPDITIDMSAPQSGANDYVQTLTTRIAGGNTPDIFHISTSTRKQILDNGYALDLSNEDFIQGLDKNAVDFYSKDGHLYGLSPTGWMGVIVYNKDLLKKVGANSVPTDLDGFIDLGKKLNDAGITPYMEDPAVISGSFAPMLQGLNAKQGTPNADDDIWNGTATISERWGSALKDWKRLVDENVIPQNVVGVSNDQIRQEFLAGNVAMIRSGLWDVEDIEAAGISYGAAPFPAVTGGQPYISGGPDSPLAINAKLEGKELEAAKKFLAFANSEKGLSILQNDAGLMSTSSVVPGNIPEEFRDVYDNYMTKGKYGWINWGVASTGMDQECTSQFQLLIQGQTTPEAVLEHLDNTLKNNR